VDTSAAQFPFHPFQLELLAGIDEVMVAFPGILQFRWRPHPCDDHEIIKRDHLRVRDLDLSLKRTIEEDIAWSDIIITSPSSTMTNALLTNRPLFVHVPPAMASLRELQAVHAKRKFFYAAELVLRIKQFLLSTLEDPNEVLASERSTRTALFGDTPDDLIDVLAALAAARARTAAMGDYIVKSGSCSHDVSQS
jgi:hypothetical protein